MGVQLISGCEDAQTSADVSGGRHIQPAGAMTTALCNSLEQRPVQRYPDLMTDIYRHLLDGGHTQRPSLTSSQPFDVRIAPFNPCGDIEPNRNPVLGRQFQKRKK